MTETPPTMTPMPASTTSNLLSPITPDPVGTPDMSYADYIRKCFQPYANFNGRARRKEYGSFVAAYFVVVFALLMLQVIITIATNGAQVGGIIVMLLSLAMWAVILGAIVPYIGVTIRRVHDIGLPAWAAIVVIFFNWIGLIVMLAVPSQDGANIYGPYSKPR